MSSTRRVTQHQGDADQQTVSRRSLTAAEMLRMTTSVPPSTLQKATMVIENYRPSVQTFVDKMMSELPPLTALDSLKFVLVIILIDLSGSESGNEEALAAADRIITEQLLSPNNPLRGSTLVAKVGFHTHPWVIQPFRRVLAPEDQVWLTHDMATIDTEYQQYYQVIKANGGTTDINLALVSAMQAGMSTLGYYATNGGLGKLLTYIETDGGQNGSIPADEAGAFLQTAEGMGNVRVGFIAIGDPYTKPYVVDKLGLPAGNVLEVDKTAEAIEAIGYHVSGSIGSMSVAKGTLSQYDLFPQVLAGEQVTIMELDEDAGGSNAFGSLTGLEELPLDEDEDNS